MRGQAPRGRREAVLTVLGASVGVTLVLTGWLAPLQRPVNDLMLRLPRPGQYRSAPIAAVLIDEDSVAIHGPLPWPRARLARITTALFDAGADGVVFDLLLNQASDEENDQALEEALSSRPVVLAAALSADGSWLLPLPRFGASRWAAHAHGEVASDGVVRFFSATKQSEGLALPALALAAAELAGAAPPVMPGARLRPDFSQPPAAIAWASAAQVLAGRAPEQLWAGRVVLIGISAAGVGDQLMIPVGNRRRPVPGVLVHAAFASSLIRGGLLGQLPWWWVMVIAAAAAGSTQLLRSAAGRLRPLHLLAPIVSLLLITIAALWLAGTVVPVVALVLVVVLSALTREVAESYQAQRQAGAVLTSLLSGEECDEAVPPGASGRLHLLQILQARVVRDRDLRRALLDGLAEGVVLWDKQGAPLLANPAATRLCGQTPRREKIAGKDQTEATEQTVIERLGRTLEVETHDLAIGSFALIRDITARRALEQRRREMQRLVSHELKTPLASLAGFGKMLELYTLSPDELQRVASLIRSESERLGEMVSTFLDLERLAAGYWNQERSAIDLAELTRERCQLLAAAAAERQQQILIRAEQAMLVSGVATLLALLVDNLVGNALKYSADEAIVEVSVAGQRFEVSDHGPGIPQAAIPRLFERFYRVPGARQAGSGLGLALVKEVADWHGACVTVDSEAGTGSRFAVTFAEYPVAEPSVEGGPG